MYFGAALAIVLSIAGITVTLTIAMVLDGRVQLFWGVNFLQAVLQDIFLSPLFSMGVNSLLIFLLVQNKHVNRRVRKVAETCCDDGFIAVVKLFQRTKKPGRSSSQQHQVFTVHSFFKFYTYTFHTLAESFISAPLRDKSASHSSQ